jgi:hypothetical protein
MAKLSAHGNELDRREYPSFRLAVMADGNILRDYGQGWKLYKRLKPGVNAVEYAASSRARYEARPPLFHEYVKAIRDAVAITHRSQLHILVSLMPNDPDGVYSEFNDNNQYSGPQIDLDDAVRLCTLYRSASEFTTEIA